MSLLIGFLTVLMVLDCLVLIFLVLIQLPKKESGAGMAFGGGATDALFGAGSGNALTMITKYAAGIFLVLSLTLSILNAHQSKNGIGKKLKEAPAAAAPASLPPPAAKAATPVATPALEASKLLTTTPTNAPAAPTK